MDTQETQALTYRHGAHRVHGGSVRIAKLLRQEDRGLYLCVCVHIVSVLCVVCRVCWCCVLCVLCVLCECACVSSAHTRFNVRELSSPRKLCNPPPHQTLVEYIGFASSTNVFSTSLSSYVFSGSNA